MTNNQMFFALVTVMALFAGFFKYYIDAKFDGVNAKFDGVNAKFDGVDGKFDGVNKRFDDMRDLWRAELRRVEEVLDARLKHLEEKG